MLLNRMYIVYEEQIEQLEEENQDLKNEVRLLRKRLEYFKFIVQEDEEE